MAALLAGLPVDVPAITVNRLCASGLDAVAMAARATEGGRRRTSMIAGGVESMSRAPFVMPKADPAFSRQAEIFDTTIGWRFINPLLKAQYGMDSMPETGENVAAQFAVSREDQDKFALRSQQRTAAAYARGFFEHELMPVQIPQRKGAPIVVSKDEHPRETTLEQLAKLPSAIPCRRLDNRWKRLRCERRLVRADHRVGSGGEALRPHAEGTHRHRGVRGRGAANHGDRADPGRAQGTGARQSGGRASWIRSSSTKPSLRRASRSCAGSASRTMRRT